MLDPRVKPTVEPVSPSNMPRAEDPIQVAERTLPNALQILMSDKRALPWLDSPPKGFLERELRTRNEMQVNIREHGVLRLANQRCFQHVYD